MRKAVISMLNKIKQACAWVVSKVKAGIDWVRNNWPAIETKTEEVTQRAYEVAISHIRKAVVAIERVMVIGIMTVERRQTLSYRQALAEAKAANKAMSDEEVCAYVAYWFRQDQAVVGA
jgi:uncharacterized protein YdaL